MAGGHFRKPCEISSCSLQRVIAAEPEFKLIFGDVEIRRFRCEKNILFGSVHELSSAHSVDRYRMSFLSSYTVVSLTENQICQVDGGSLHFESRIAASEHVQSLISKAVVRSL